MIHYSGIRKHKILLLVAAWMNLKDIILNEISQAQNNKYFTFSLVHGMLTIWFTQWKVVGTWDRKWEVGRKKSVEVGCRVQNYSYIEVFINYWPRKLMEEKVCLGLIVSEVWESMIIMVRSMVAGSRGSRATA